MLSMASFKSYGKVNEVEQAMLIARQKTRKRILIISLSSILLVAVIVAAVVGTTVGKSKNSGENYVSASSSIKAVCDVTLYPDSCQSSLSPMINSTDEINPKNLFKLSILVAINELSKISQKFSYGGEFFNVSDNMTKEALKNCDELLGFAWDNLNLSISSTDDFQNIDDLKTWLSSVITYHDTCIDGFENSDFKNIIQNYLKNSTEFSSNSLAIFTWISNVAGRLKLRRLMSGETPEWMVGRGRELLQAADLRKTANYVVAKDGSGKYKTIAAALKAVPEKSKKMVVIYVKKGVYNENVRVEKSTWNVTFVGDGKDVTIVSGSLNVVDGTPTFSTATFAVFGQGFTAIEMGFRNTAGAIKHQAVALIASADRVVFYRCRFDAFQDTLYVHAQRQFYRECDIYGTVDFIFGNSAVVFQNCNILPRVPMLGQQNTITAQGKSDPNQNTGISIQNCTIWPYGNLSSVRTYLGRPWKNYSTTLYVHSMMGSLIDGAGWLPWVGNSAPDTIFYSEFENYGPGAVTKNRVKWKGLKSLNLKQVGKFSVKAFLQGDQWITKSGVSYKSRI